MKKALLIVHRYQSELDASWGYAAKDYATMDMIKNISKKYPTHEWRPATLAEARILLREHPIDLVMLVPIMEKHKEELDAYPDVTIDSLDAVEYATISKPPFKFLQKWHP